MDALTDITEQRSKQLLSLDALDLSFLPITYQPWLRDSSDFLWRSNSFLPDKKNYYEFIVKSKTDDVDESREKTNHTICHICNTAVPKAYVFEHVNSSKHIAYQKIAETGLERTRKHKRMIEIGGLNTGLEYFCEHCVAVIYLSNRNEHEKSKSHKNFVAFDAFLDNFALFYNNNEPADNIESVIPVNEELYDVSLLEVDAKMTKTEVENIEFELLHLKSNCDDENTELEKDVCDLETKLKDSKVLIDNIESCLDNVHKELNNNVDEDEYEKAHVVKNLQQYIRRLNAYGSVKLRTLDALNQDRIKIETSDASELIVSTFNFHGLKKIGKYLKCKLCDCVIDSLTNHRLHEKHMTIVAQPFEDKHSIRHIQGSLFHCVVCNEVIDDVVIHTQFNEHIKKLERALIPIENNPENPNTVNSNDAVTSVKTDPPKPSESNVNKLEPINENTNRNINKIASTESASEIIENRFYCSICNIEMHINNVETHLNGTKHKAICTSAIYYLMNKDKNKKYTCKVCDVSVNYFTWAVEDHIASTNHIENFNDCLTNNKINRVANGFFCRPCRQKISKMTELSHIETQSHKVKLASYNITSIERNHVIGIEKKSVEGIEKKDVEDIKDGSNEIYRSDITKKQLSDLSAMGKQTIELDKSHNDSTNALSSKDNANDNEITEVDPRASERNVSREEDSSDSCNIKTHNNSAKHKTMDVLLTGVNNLLEELLKYFNSPQEIHSHLQLTNVENVLNCVVCSDNIKIDDTEKHTNSLKHIHKHRNLMAANKLQFKEDRYVCNACNVYVEAGKELKHIETVDHEKRIESLNNGDCVLITADNKKLIDKIQQILNKNDSEYEEKPKNIIFGDFITINKAKDITNVRHHYADLVDNEKQLLCMLCQELVENTEQFYRTHANESDHRKKYKTVMAYNQLFPIQEGFVCGYCECTISDEFEHISSEKHVDSQRSYPKKNYCFTCKVSTILNLEDHVTSDSHIKNIRAPSYYCNICDITITNCINIQTHNDGFRHQNNISLIDKNKLILKNKKFSCQVCELCFSRDFLEDHVNSPNHVMLLGPINS